MSDTILPNAKPLLGRKPLPENIKKVRLELHLSPANRLFCQSQGMTASRFVEPIIESARINAETKNTPCKQ